MNAPGPIADTAAGPGTRLGPGPVRLGPSAAARCRRRIHLDAAHPVRSTSPSAAAIRSLAELADHRSTVLATIAELHRTTTAGDWQTRPQPVVVNPTMATATRSGAADLLLWAGDGYLPVIVRAHRTRDAGAGARFSTFDDPLTERPDPTHRLRRQRADRLVLAHHYRQLTDLGCASSAARGGVIGRGSPTDGAGRPDPIGLDDDAAVIVWHALDPVALGDYDARFADRLAVATAAATDRPALALPSRIAECRRCPWWPDCSQELQAAKDISLLLAGGDVAAARAAGVPTIPALAALGRAALKRIKLQGISPEHAQLEARAWMVGVPLIRVGARAQLRRADVELDVDAESYGEDGPYLWGARLSGADIGLPQEYRAFVTWDQLPAVSQAEVFGQFFDHVRAVRAAATGRGLTVAVYCYGKAAEERWMLGLARRYAGVGCVPDEQEVLDFCASPDWVDLLVDLKKHFLAPGSLRLKEIAGRLGFAWRDPEPGGENSMAWYREVLDSPGGPDEPQHSHPMAIRILQYNEDDVLATASVRRWVTAHLGELPTVADLTSPDWATLRDRSAAPGQLGPGLTPGAPAVRLAPQGPVQPADPQGR